MEIENYLNKMKEIQITLLRYIEDEANFEVNYNNLIKLFNDGNILNIKFEFKSVIYLLLNISNNHHRGTNFFDKIFRIFANFPDTIKKYFSNYEIFNIFKSNNRILLYLIEEKLIVIDDSVANAIKNSDNKAKFFFEEIKTFLDVKLNQKISRTIPKNYEELRKIGENDDTICQLIRNDSVTEFDEYVNKNNVDLNSTVKNSIFETNSLLIEKNTKLIEYAAFYGSMKIFNYFVSKNIDLSPSLWIYAIHSQNFELIHFLNEKKIYPHDFVFDKFLKESIKCHHFEITKYIQSNFYQNQNSCNIFTKSLKHFNFVYIQKDCINKYAFHDLCYYDYFMPVDILLKTGKIDINSKKIFICFLYSILNWQFLNSISNHSIQ